MCLCQTKGIPVARGEKFRLSLISSPPDRARSVDYVGSREFVTPGDFCLTRRAAFQSAAFLEELWPRRPMNGSVHTASSEKSRIGGVYDGIHLATGNISLQKHDTAFDIFHHGSSFSFLFS